MRDYNQNDLYSPIHKGRERRNSISNPLAGISVRSLDIGRSSPRRKLKIGEVGKSEGVTAIRAEILRAGAVEGAEVTELRKRRGRVSHLCTSRGQTTQD